MALSDDLEALVKRHGATSYRNRADTQNPAFGFSVAGLVSLLDEVRAAEREACAQACDSEESRALFNFDNDLEANRPFWNGCSQSATSCAASIRARGKS